ncbi:hypothetical protein GCM10027093_54850 [Paraburkholderia jirisanensis]
MKRIRIIGSGEQVAYLDQNAAGTSRESEERTMSDPIELFIRYINAGFSTSNARGGGAASMELVSSIFDDASGTQHWALDIDDSHIEELRIAANLLLAIDIAPELALVEEKNGQRTQHLLGIEQGDWPARTTQPPFEFEQELDPEDSIHGCDVQIEFERELTKDGATAICAAVEIWSDVVMRSGFAPPGDDPANAGTIPAGTYQHDPNTIATGTRRSFSSFVLKTIIDPMTNE